ncbi:MAG: hypothetical protein ACO28O_04985 [Crocinitomicaceae bacterium]
MKRILMLIVVNVIFSVQASDSLKVLFIGNSYTYANDLPGMFAQIASALGDWSFVDSKTNGGYTFQMHAQDPLTYQKIHAHPWNYVILQGQSQEPSFPFAQVNSQTLPFAVQISDSVHSIQPCAQVNFFMTWGRENGDPQWDSINTFHKMNDRLRSAYLRIADSSNGSVSPVGAAWRNFRDLYPSISLYSGDGSHPNTTGTFLAAATFYSALYHKTIPNNLSYNPGIDPIVLGNIIQCVNATVMDSLSTWKLMHHDSLLVFNATYLSGGIPGSYQFEANCPNCESLVWNFDDNQTAQGASVLHTFQPGTFWVTCTGNNACGTYTDSLFIQVGGVNQLEHHSLKLTIQAIGPNQWSIEPWSFGAEALKAFDYMGRHVPILAWKRSEVSLEFSTPIENPILFSPQFSFIRPPIWVEEH